MRQRCVVVFCLMWIGCFHVGSQANVLLDGQQSYYDLGKDLQVLEDVNGDLRIQDVMRPELQSRFVPKHKSVFSFGFNKSVYWLKVSLHNLAANKRWLIEQRWPNTHYISVFWYDEKTKDYKRLDDGSLSTSSGSTIAHRRPLFDIELPSGVDRDFYIRIQSDAAKVVNIRLWEGGAFEDYHQTDLLVLGAFYGAMLLLAFCNYLLYFYFYRISQLWLASFILSISIGISIFEGLHTAVLPQSYHAIAQNLFIPLAAFAMMFLLAFSMRLFSRHISLLARRVVQCFYALFSSVIVFFIFDAVQLGTQMFLILFSLCVLFLTAYSGKLLFSGNYLVRFFSLGLACFLVGGYSQIMLTYGLLQDSEWSKVASRVGVLLMGVFFTFAFVDVVKWLTREKNRIDSALRETEQKFRAIFQQSFQLSALLSREGRILDVNEPVSELNLMPKEKMLGLPLWDVTLAADNIQSRKRIKKEFNRARQGETRRLEVQIESATGELRWLDISLKPLLENKDSIERILAEARDISRQKKIQYALTLLAETASFNSGRNFFENAVVQLCDVYAVDYAMVLAKSAGDSIQTTAICKQNKLLTNITFPLSATPLNDVKQASELMFIEDALKHYPDDPLINSFHINTYIACPIFNPQSEILGHVVLMHHKSLSESDRMMDVLQVFAARIGSEIESERASRLLKDTKQRLSAHLKNTPLAVIELDNKLCVTEWNTAAFHMYGYTREEAIGSRISELILNKDGYMDDDELQLTFFSNMEGQYSRMSNVARDGVNLVCDWYKTLLYDEYGELVGVAALVADVSIEQRALRELKKQERDQRIILDSLLDSVIVIDKQGNILSVNSVTQRMFGYKEHEVIGKKVNLLMPEEFAKEHDRYLSNFEETGEAKIIGVTRSLKAKRKDGSLFPIRLTVSELANSEVTEAGFIGFIHDMTDVQRQEEQMRRSQKMDALGKLTGGIAHDFNNLMGIILGYAEFIIFGAKPGSDANKYASEIIKAGERGANLTKKLLSFSKAHGGHQEQVNLNDILKSNEDLLKKTVTPRITLKLQLTDNIHPVRLDKNDLEDAVLNMSINASHAISGSGTITIETQNCDFDQVTAEPFDLKPGSYVMLSISDTGIGMNEETMHSIFDPFYSTKGEMGTGLGLSQVYGFVERSAGVIRVYSELGVGSSFKLFFPKSRTDADLKTNETVPITEDENLKGNERILVVDDEPALLYIVSESLGRYGYKVDSVESGEDALAMLREQHYDVLLSDVVMPGMDGYELANVVRQEFPEVRIQLASGFTDDRHTTPEDEELTNAILRKPYQTRAVLQKIRELLRS